MALRFLTAAVFLIPLGGCATLNGIPAPLPNVSTACPVEEENPPSVTGDLAEMCRVVKAIDAHATTLSNAYREVSGTRTAVQTLAIVSAVAGTGFVVFDAHPDNIRGAGLTTGVLSLLNSGLNMNQRADILRDGVVSSSCFVSIGNIFVQGHVQQEDGNGGPKSRAERIGLAIENLGAMIELARRHMAQNPPAAGDQQAAAKRAELAASIAQAVQIHDDLQRARRAFDRAPSEIDRAWREADALLNNRLEGIRPDIAALIAEAQALSESINQPTGEPQAPETVSEGQNIDGRSVPVDDAGFLQALRDMSSSARQLDAEHYIAAFERIPACKAQAAT